MENLDLNQEQLDALKEIGNIGGGNAATALSQILGKRVSIRIPTIRFLSLDELSGSEFLMKPEELSIAVSLKILGRLQGAMLVLFPKRDALLMIDILTQRESGSTEIFTTIDESALSETAHILCCSYLNAVGELLGLYQLIPSITQTAVDKADKLSRALIKRFIGADVRYVLPIENHLSIEDIELNLFVVFLLESESLKKILGILGL